MNWRRSLTIAALALPVADTMASIVGNEAALRGATEWRISITGYDPRDPLRGRYIRFRYDWQVVGERRDCRDATCRLCLEDGGRRIRIEPADTTCPAPIDAAASRLELPFDRTGSVVADGTRLWVSEASAPMLERQLQTRPMVAVARLTRDGRLIAERLEPR